MIPLKTITVTEKRDSHVYGAVHEELMKMRIEFTKKSKHLKEFTEIEIMMYNSQVKESALAVVSYKEPIK